MYCRGFAPAAHKPPPGVNPRTQRHRRMEGETAIPLIQKLHRAAEAPQLWRVGLFGRAPISHTLFSRTLFCVWLCYVHNTNLQGPAVLVLRRPRGRRLIPLAGIHHGSSRLALRRRCVLFVDPLPHRLPLQAPQDRLHHQNLPPQHQRQRQHLLGHPKRSVVPSAHHIQGALVHLLVVDGRES